MCQFNGIFYLSHALIRGGALVIPSGLCFSSEMSDIDVEQPHLLAPESMPVLLPAEQVAALGAYHAEREAACDFAAVMATLNDHPVYDYPNLRKRFSGRDKAEQFYTYFFAHFSPHVVAGRLLREWANDTSVAQEYDITLSISGQQETHRVLGVLYVVGDRLGGETIYASEAAVRRMLGPLFEELEDY